MELPDYFSASLWSVTGILHCWGKAPSQPGATMIPHVTELHHPSLPLLVTESEAVGPDPRGATVLGADGLTCRVPFTDNYQLGS